MYLESLTLLPSILLPSPHSIYLFLAVRLSQSLKSGPRLMGILEACGTSSGAGGSWIHYFFFFLFLIIIIIIIILYLCLF